MLSLLHDSRSLVGSSGWLRRQPQTLGDKVESSTPDPFLLHGSAGVNNSHDSDHCLVWRIRVDPTCTHVYIKTVQVFGSWLSPKLFEEVELVDIVI